MRLRGRCFNKLGRIKMQNFNKNKKGFSLPEVIVAMFIFVLMMLVVTSVFATMVKTRKNARDMQQRVENVRYAMELMAKNIRMSSVDNLSSGSADNEIYIYNYSQEKCMHFEFNTPSVYMSEVSGQRNVLTDCSSASYGDATELALKNITDTQFVYYAPKDSSGNPIADSSLGRVTMAMRTSTGESIQTTVSLRNYSRVNP